MCLLANHARPQPCSNDTEVIQRDRLGGIVLVLVGGLNVIQSSYLGGHEKGSLTFSEYALTMNFDATPSNIAAAGHSGQKSTVRRSAIKLSKIARYSVSLAFFVVLVLPELPRGFFSSSIPTLLTAPELTVA